jgi:hypothetical protein
MIIRITKSVAVSYLLLVSFLPSSCPRSASFHRARKGYEYWIISAYSVSPAGNRTRPEALLEPSRTVNYLLLDACRFPQMRQDGVVLSNPRCPLLLEVVDRVKGKAAMHVMAGFAPACYHTTSTMQAHNVTTKQYKSHSATPKNQLTQTRTPQLCATWETNPSQKRLSYHVSVRQKSVHHVHNQRKEYTGGYG